MTMRERLSKQDHSRDRQPDRMKKPHNVSDCATADQKSASSEEERLLVGDPALQCLSCEIATKLLQHELP